MKVIVSAKQCDIQQEKRLLFAVNPALLGLHHKAQ